MSEPRTKADWNVILSAIGWIQDHWEELQKASDDVRDFGTGYVRITAGGVKHVPLPQIVIMPEKVVDEIRNADQSTSQK